MLRGRKSVLVDHRLRTDEKHIRTQSAILYKNNRKPWLVLSITVFLVRMCLLSVPKTRLARAARKSDGRVGQYSSGSCANIALYRPQQIPGA
jgi:hypothetical protein